MTSCLLFALVGLSSNTETWRDELKLVFSRHIPSDANVKVAQQGVFRIVGMGPAAFRSRPPDFKPLPAIRPDGNRAAYYTSLDSYTYRVDLSGSMQNFRVFDLSGKVRLSVDMSMLGEPIVHNLNNIALMDRRQWFLNGEFVNFPRQRDWTGTAEPRTPNEQRTLVYAVSTIRPGKQPTGPNRTWMDVWKPFEGWTRVEPPEGYWSLIPGWVQSNDWVTVRLTNEDLNHMAIAMIGISTNARQERYVAPGPVRFWRNGVFAGATPPDLVIPTRHRKKPFTHYHTAAGKFGALEIYESNAYTSEEWRSSREFAEFSQLQFRLNGKWVPIRQALPFYKGKDGDLTFIRESGGYLFFTDEGKRELLIVKLPEAWRK